MKFNDFCAIIIAIVFAKIITSKKVYVFPAYVFQFVVAFIKGVWQCSKYPNFNKDWKKDSISITNEKEDVENLFGATNFDFCTVNIKTRMLPHCNMDVLELHDFYEREVFPNDKTIQN